MMFDLDLLPIFATFARTLSFTETGRVQGLTQPAVHGQVKRLTEQIGVPLYRRRGRSLELTQRGQELAALARDVLTARDAFLHQPRPITIAAGRGAWTHLLFPRLGNWIRTHEIRPVVADGPSSARQVLDGVSDFGVSTRPPEVCTRLLCSVGTHILLPPAHPLAAEADLDLRQLRREKWILPSPGRPHRVVLESMFEGLPEVVAVADDWAVMVEFVAAGLGIAAVNDFVSHPSLVGIPLRGGPVHDYHLFWRRPELDRLVQELR